jgi:hypothetical protein
MSPAIGVADLIAALALPADTRVDRRVPKKLLLEQGAPTAADKRQIQDGIDELTWVAALKPNTIGVPAFRDEVREYLEIAVVAATLRSEAKGTRLESNEAVKLYAKLPGWFKVPTPLGTYNPDWAVLIEKDGAERLYLVVETKSSLFKDDLRGTEGGKIECGKAHFKALAVGDNPARYIVATKFDDLMTAS